MNPLKTRLALTLAATKDPEQALLRLFPGVSKFVRLQAYNCALSAFAMRKNARDPTDREDTIRLAAVLLQAAEEGILPSRMLHSPRLSHAQELQNLQQGPALSQYSTGLQGQTFNQYSTGLQPSGLLPAMAAQAQAQAQAQAALAQAALAQAQAAQEARALKNQTDLIEASQAKSPVLQRLKNALKP